MIKFDIPFSREEVRSLKEQRLEIRLSPQKDPHMYSFERSGNEYV